MTMPVALRRSGTGSVVTVAVFLIVAALVGTLATMQSTMAVALVVAAIVALVVAQDVTALPLFLVFTMFVESLSLGPALRVGRLGGALALLVVVYYLLDRGRAGLRVNALVAAIGGWGAWALASTFWAEFDGRVIATLSSYLLGIAYTFAFALLVRRPSQLRWVYAVLVVGSLVFGLYSFVQYAGSAGGGETRAAGLQGDPNYFAVYQVIALAPTLVLAAFEKRAQRRVLLYGVVAVIVLSVVSSLSRTGIISLVLVVLATLLLPTRLFFARSGRKLGYVAALVLAAFLAVAVGSTALVARVQSIFSGTSASGDRGAGRTDLWAAAWHGYTGHPWLGLGAGNFSPRALDLLQTTPGVDTTRNYITTANVVHNGYLEQLTELGPVGLALWLAILLLSARYLVRAARRARAAGNLELERLAAAAAVSLVGYGASVFFLSNELGKPIWIFAGLALALDVMTKRWQPLLAGSGAYDRRVPEPDDPQRRLQRELMELVQAQERLDRRRAALDEREREIEGRQARETTASRELPLRVAALEQEVAERDALVARLQGQLADAQGPTEQELQLRGRVQAVEQLLAERDEAVAQLQRELGASTGAVERLRRELEAAQEPDGRVRVLEEAVAERDALVARLQRQVEDAQGPSEEELRLRGRVEAVERLLAERDEAVAQLQQELGARTGAVEQLRRELAAAQEPDGRVGVLEEAVAEREERIAELQRELGARIDGLEQSVTEREQLVERLRREAQVASDGERRVAARVGALEEAVAEREERIAELQHELGARIGGLEQSVAEREQLVERLQRELREAQRESEEERRLAARVAALEKVLAVRDARVAALEEQLAEPVQAPPRQPPPPPVVEREAAPSPPPAPPAVDTGGPFEVSPGRWRLDALEAAVAAHRDDPRYDEWSTYAVFLRDHVEPDGGLPATFDSLVDEVFGALVARARNGS